MTARRPAGASARFLRLIVVVGLLALGLGAAPRTQVAAQESGLIDDSTFRFGLDGTEIRWEGDWEYDPEASGQFDGYEIASLISPTAGLLIGEILSVVPVDLNVLLALVLDTLAEDADEFVTVERSATDTVSYSLDAAVVDGIATALFTYVQFNPQAGIITYTSVFSDYAGFADNIADAQANVTVGGRIALEGIDGATLQNLLPPLAGGSESAGGGRPGEDDDSDDTRSAPDDEDEDQDEGEDDTRTVPNFGNDDNDEDEGALPDDEQGRGETDDDLAALGVVDDGLYESPQYGVEIEWGGDWELNPDFVTSDEDDEVDGLGFVINEGEAIILISVFAAEGAAPADFAAFWESDDFLAENTSGDAEVLLADSDRSEGGVLIVEETDDGGELWTLRQAYALDGGDTIAIATMLGLGETFPDRLADAQDDIAIDGDPFLGFFSVDDVEDAA